MTESRGRGPSRDRVRRGPARPITSRFPLRRWRGLLYDNALRRSEPFRALSDTDPSRMTESEFGEELADLLRARIGGKLEIETRRSLLYTVAFDDEGRLLLGLNDKREPVRGGGTGFEQDLVIFLRTPSGDTSIVPRVIIELKFGGVTTHDTIVYSEKARRIKVIYPFARYGLVLGQHPKVPPRVLRLGSEFDFIVAVDANPSPEQEHHLTALLVEEIGLSEGMIGVLNGRSAVRSFRRKLEIE